MINSESTYKELVQKIQDLEARIFKLQDKELKAAREKAAENEKARDSIERSPNDCQDWKL